MISPYQIPHVYLFSLLVTGKLNINLMPLLMLLSYVPQVANVSKIQYLKKFRALHEAPLVCSSEVCVAAMLVLLTA
jgi:hypothetical protein